MTPQFNNTIHDLLVKYLLGEASPGEQVQVEAWITENAENEREYRHFKNLWEESLKLAASTTTDTDAAWLRMKTRLQAQTDTPAPVITMRRRGAWMRIAALFILVAGATWWLVTQQEEPLQSLAINTTTEAKKDTLPDGSIVTLNKNSRLTYPSRFKGDTRAIALKGEAFFEVTPNKEQPFTISVNDITVRVVGTSFNIRSEGGKTEVIVETGIVQVIRGGKMVELRPKEKVAVSPQDSVLQKAPVEDALYNYYRTRTFACDNTPLWKLVEVLNEAYDTRITIGRPELRTLPLTVTFNNESLDQVLQVVGETLSIEVVRKTGEIVLQ